MRLLCSKNNWHWAKIIYVLSRQKKLVATSYTSCSYTQHLFNSLQNEIAGRSMKSRTDLVHSYVNIAVNITIYHCGGFYRHGSVLFIILQEYINFVILFLLFLGSSCGLTKQDSKVSCDLLTPAFRVLAFGIINWSGCVENGL